MATTLLLVGSALIAAWLGLVLVLALVGRGRFETAEAIRILPDTLRLLRRLTRDRSLPRHVRFRLVLALAYLAFPIDVIPDFVPGIGHVDDIVIVGAALRSMIRRAGPETVEAHWPGTTEGLATLYQLVGLPRGA